MTWMLAGLLLIGCGPEPAQVAEQLRSTNPAVRQDTARRARNFNSPEVIAALVESLDDPSEQVRLNAIESLIALHAKDAVPRLMEVMIDDEDPRVRRSAIDALGRIADPRAVQPLIALLEQTKLDQPPLNAIWSLGEIGDLAALDVLSQLRESEDPYVQYNANQALRRLRPAGEG